MSAQPPRPPQEGAEEEEVYVNQQGAEGEQGFEDDDEAFIDLDDPENQVEEIDDAGAPPPEDDEDDQAAAEQQPQGEFPEDKEPERDDAVFVWTPADADAREPLHSVAAHPSNPALVAAAGEKEQVFVLDVTRRTANSAAAAPNAVVATLGGHKDTITQLAFSPDGSVLASGSMDCTVRLWSTSSFECLHVLEDLSGEVEFLLWHPSGKVLLGGGADAQCLLWNTVKGAVAQYFVGHSGAVTCGAWAMDHKRVLTGSADGSLMVFNPKTGQCDANINKDLSTVNAAVTCVAAAGAAAEVFVAGCEDGSLHVVSMQRMKVTKTLDDIHEQAIEAISFAALDSGIPLFATCSCDCKVVVWSSADFSVRSVTRCGEGITRLLWVKELLLAGCTDGDTRVWDGRVAAGEPRTTLMGHRRLILGLAATADAGHIVTCADDGSVRAFVQSRYTLDEPAVAKQAVQTAMSDAAAAAPAARPDDAADE